MTRRTTKVRRGLSSRASATALAALFGGALSLTACETAAPDAAIGAASADRGTAPAVKTATLLYASELTRSSHGSDGSDRARNGKPRFTGPLGARGVSHAGHQYVVYYTGKDRALGEDTDAQVVIARRALDGGDWERSVLQDYTLTSDDAHNRQTIAVSEGDGAIHIAFDHHNEDSLNYARTATGVADDPGGTAWTDDVFTYQEDLGLDDVSDMTITYPDLTAFPGGNLIMYFRNGGSYGGDMRLARYDAEAGAWLSVRDISSRFGTYEGLETTRGPYTARGMQVGPDGALHVAWVFRERPCAQEGTEAYCNHGLYYAVSPDEGVTWRRADGSLIADTGRGETISIANAGPEVIDIPKSSAPSNVSIASAVDPETGAMHVMIKHADESGTQRTHHYIGAPDGAWRGGPSPFAASDVEITFDGDKLYAFGGRREPAVYVADRSDGFSTWQEIALPAPAGETNPPAGGYATWDLSRLGDGVASLVWHQAPADGVDGTPSPVWVLDYGL